MSKDPAERAECAGGCQHVPDHLRIWGVHSPFIDLSQDKLLGEHAGRGAQQLQGEHLASLKVEPAHALLF